MEAALAVRQLALVNDQPGVHAVLGHRVQDLVERNRDFFEVGLEELQRQISAGHASWNRDFFSLDFFRRHGPHAGQDGAVAIADAGSAGHQDVLVGDIGIGVIRNGGQFVGAFQRLTIQGFDVFEDVPEGNQP